MSSPGESLPQAYFQALGAYRDGRTEESLGLLRKLAEASVCPGDVFEALSVILINEKRYDESIVILKRWIAANPSAIMARTNLSRCYAARGMILEAEHEQAEARRLTWKAELKEKKLAMPKVDYEEKISRYKQIIDLDPNDVLGYFSLGSVYLEAGRKREAMDVFEKAVSVNPSHTASYDGWGQALEGLGDLERAAHVYTRGIAVGESQGDMLPQKRMESRLRSVQSRIALKPKPPDA
ncbi:MAG: tetratricopeptide repeat protein [Candidatus Omnitrophica bacterium]|nr:tetratricopeptide repeat protein [Candidatus Omnitrophota bacterium]